MQLPDAAQKPSSTRLPWTIQAQSLHARHVKYSEAPCAACCACLSPGHRTQANPCSCPDHPLPISQESHGAKPPWQAHTHPPTHPAQVMVEGVRVRVAQHARRGAQHLGAELVCPGCGRHRRRHCPLVHGLGVAAHARSAAVAGFLCAKQGVGSQAGDRWATEGHPGRRGGGNSSVAMTW